MSEFLPKIWPRPSHDGAPAVIPGALAIQMQSLRNSIIHAASPQRQTETEHGESMPKIHEKGGEPEKNYEKQVLTLLLLRFPMLAGGGTDVSDATAARD